MAAAGRRSELEWTESGSVGLLPGPGLGLEAEVSQIVRVVLVQHRLVGLGLTECLLVLVEVLVAALQEVELGVVELGVAVLVGVSVKLPQEPAQIRASFG